MGREAGPQKATFSEWRRAGDIPKSCLVTDRSRCIAEVQAAHGDESIGDTGLAFGAIALNR